MNQLRSFFHNLFVTWPIAGYTRVTSASWKQRGVGLSAIILSLLLVWWGDAIEEKKDTNYVVMIDVFGPKESAIFTCGEFFSPRIGIQPNSLVEIGVEYGHGFWVSNPDNPAEQGTVAAFDDVCHIVFAIEGQRYRLTSGITRIKTRIGGPMSFEIGLHPGLNPESQIVSGSGLTATTFNDFNPGKVKFVIRQVDAFSPYSTAAQTITSAATAIHSGGNASGALPVFLQPTYQAAEEKVVEAASAVAKILEASPPEIPQGVKDCWNNRFNQPITRPNRFIPSATASVEFEAAKLKFDEAKEQNNLAEMQAALAEMQVAAEIKSTTN